MVVESLPTSNRPSPSRSHPSCNTTDPKSSPPGNSNHPFTAPTPHQVWTSQTTDISGYLSIIDIQYVHQYILRHLSKFPIFTNTLRDFHYYINTLSHILWTYLLRNCRTDCRHFQHAGALWSNVQHGLCEIMPDGQVWDFLAIF